MHKTAVALTIGLGVIAILLIIVWCVAGAGVYGSPLGHFHGSAILGLFLLLLVGPLSILPAGLVGRSRPVLAGAWLIALSHLSLFLILSGVVTHGLEDFFRTLPTFKEVLVVSACCTPTLLLGCLFLCSVRGRLTEFFAERWSSASFRKSVALFAGALVAALVVWRVIEISTRPVWKVTVTPEGGTPACVRFDPRDCDPANPEVGSIFDPLFEKAVPSGSVTLGRYELRCPGKDHGNGPILTYTLVAERTPAGLLLIRRNGTPIDRDMNDDAAFSNARRFVIREILEKAWREFPYQGPSK